MGASNSEALSGRAQPPTLGAALQRLVGTRTIRLGGTTATKLADILLDQHRVYQRWLSSGTATDCERDVASSRLIAIEATLDQLGISPEAIR